VSKDEPARLRLDFGLIDRFADAAETARDEEELQAAFLGAIQTIGLTNFGYVAEADATRPPEIRSSYPDVWTQRYIKSHYVIVDPVIRHAKLASPPFFWGKNPLNTLEDLPPLEREFMNEAETYDLRAGITVATTGSLQNGRFAAVTLPFDPSCYRIEGLASERALPHLLALQFHTQMNRLDPRQEAAPPKLSKRECACLFWTAHGKTRQDIAVILDLSARTVGFHIENAKAKLGASSVTHAVALAMRYGLISL